MRERTFRSRFGGWSLAAAALCVGCGWGEDERLGVWAGAAGEGPGSGGVSAGGASFGGRAGGSAGSAGHTGSGGHAGDPKRPPNLVVFLADDLGYGDLPSYGHPTIQTPHLDALAAAGARLTDAYAAAPVCSPSRASLLTGRTPARVGVDNWIDEGSPVHLRASEVTVATLLRDAGYATALVGKWHCSGRFDGSQPLPDDHGFDYWFVTQNNALPSHRDPTNFVRNGVAVGPLVGYSSDLIADEAVAWLQAPRASEQPFLLFVWFHSPHLTLATAPEYTALYPGQREAVYFGNVTQLDAAVGRVLAAVDALGARDDTLVLFTSDNGPRRPGPANVYASAGGLRGWKGELWEGGVRVPMLVRWPGHIAAGSVSPTPFHGVDLLPTLAAVARTEPPRDRVLDGVDARAAWRGEPVPRTRPLYWRFDATDAPPYTRALRDGDWKLVTSEDGASVQLFALGRDPAERSDVAATQPGVVAQLTAARRELEAEIELERPSF